jgi:hypothetical protein
MILYELFNQPLSWQWDRASSGDGEEYATFSTNTTPYHVSFIRHDGAEDEGADVWSVEFGVDGVDPKESMGVTGSGEAAVVFATVVDIIRAFMRSHRAIFLVFSAGGASRVNCTTEWSKLCLQKWRSNEAIVAIHCIESKPNLVLRVGIRPTLPEYETGVLSLY